MLGRHSGSCELGCTSVLNSSSKLVKEQRMLSTKFNNISIFNKKLNQKRKSLLQKRNLKKQKPLRKRKLKKQRLDQHKN